MGRIFTWRQIESNQVPEPKNFRDAISWIQKSLAREPSIMAATICGSVIRGDHTVRSDIDCIAVFETRMSRTALAALQMLNTQIDLLNVPLNFVLCDTELFRTRMHHFGPSFRDHVQRSMRAGGIIKGDPLKTIATSVTREQSTEEYLRFKMHYFWSHWVQYSTMNDADKATFLTKAYEAPLHVARKVLSWFGPLAGDSKEYIKKQYEVQMLSHFITALHNLVSIDQEYSKALAKQIRTQNKEDYLVVLEYLESQVPEVLKFVHQNLLFIGREARG